MLIVAALGALAWANSTWGRGYHDFWDASVSVGVGVFTHAMSLEHWVNEGMVDVFFLLVGDKCFRGGRGAGRLCSRLTPIAEILPPVVRAHAHMDRHAVRDRLDHERRVLAQDCETIERLPALTRLRATDGSYYEIAYSSLGADDADMVIAAEVEHHARLGVPFEWKLYAHDTPTDLLQRLCRHGFEAGPVEAVLVLDLKHPHDWIREAAGTHVVARVSSVEEVETYRRVAEAAFADGDDHAPIAAALKEAIRRGSTQQYAYVAYAGDKPVSVGRLYTHPESAFAGLYGGATLDAYRGRGFYRAIVAARALNAAAAGAQYLRVDALPTSRPILERLGFHWVTDTWPCEWHPPVRRVSNGSVTAR